jgi:hypothetical protein
MGLLPGGVHPSEEHGRDTHLLPVAARAFGNARMSYGPGNLSNGAPEFTPVQRFTGTVSLAYTIDR